jgi:hypothetical protein
MEDDSAAGSILRTIVRLVVRTWSLDLLLVVVLAATVILTVLGSGSVLRLLSLGSNGRWVGLFATWAIAATFAWRARHRLPRRVPVGVFLAVAFPTLGLVSALWSFEPKLTAERAIALGILVTAAIMLGYAASDDVVLQRSVVIGLVAGASIAAIGGGLLVLVSHADAVQASGPGNPWRYRGLGENPNTFAMLAAVALPLAVGLLLTASSRASRLAAGLGGLSLYLSVLLSGSRGAFLAATAGLLVVGVFVRSGVRMRFAGAGAAVAVSVLGFAIAVEIPQAQPPVPVSATAQPPTPSPTETPSTSAGGSGASSVPTSSFTFAPASAFFPGRLADELYRPDVAPTKRRLLSSSGRVQAWATAIEQVRQRPLLGFGFGTESDVFVDRVYFFQGGAPENSWIGAALEVGLVGVALLAAIWCTLAWTLFRHRPWRDRADGGLAPAVLGAVAAGLLLTVGQSYIYRVGNVATAAVWVSLMLLVGMSLGSRRTSR